MFRSSYRAVRRLRTTLRRTFAWGTGSWFVIVALGVPLPSGPSVAKPGGPFPCQHHACGCRSAGECWQDCCCFSLDEKLAWAKANGVAPPDSALAAARRRREDAVCTTRDAGRACCTKKASTEKRSACCSSEKESPSEKPHVDDEESDGVRFLTVLQAMKCGGASTGWIGTGQPFLQTPSFELTDVETLDAPVESIAYAPLLRRHRYVGPPG